MAKKIQLHKQTLRVLSAEEMEAVAGGADVADGGPDLKSSISCLSFNCVTDTMAASTASTTDTSDDGLPDLKGSISCLSFNC